MKKKDKDEIEISQLSSVKKETVCAVVVTYNRKVLLLECLEALRKQTRPLDAIYIIDNASTDGTPEILLKNNYIPKLPPSDLIEPWEISFLINRSPETEINSQLSIIVNYVRMHKNTGGAGGFYEGVKRGYEKGYDWLWLMDDDAIPKENALETMISNILFKDSRVGILVPIIYGIDGKIQKYHHKILNPLLEETSALGNGDFYINNIPNMIKIPIKLDANCFVGPLINRNAISKAGFPEKNFFLWADDLEYTYRISRYFKIYLIPQSYILHKDFNPLLSKKNKDRVPFNSYWKHYYGIRNVICFKNKYMNKKYKLFYYCKLLYQIIRHTAGILLYDDYKLYRLKIIFFAYYDGVMGNLGKRLGPKY